MESVAIVPSHWEFTRYCIATPGVMAADGLLCDVGGKIVTATTSVAGDTAQTRCNRQGRRVRRSKWLWTITSRGIGVHFAVKPASPMTGIRPLLPWHGQRPTTLTRSSHLPHHCDVAHRTNDCAIGTRLIVSLLPVDACGPSCWLGVHEAVALSPSRLTAERDEMQGKKHEEELRVD